MPRDLSLTDATNFAQRQIIAAVERWLGEATRVTRPHVPALLKGVDSTSATAVAVVLRLPELLTLIRTMKLFPPDPHDMRNDDRVIDAIRGTEDE